MDFKVKSFLCWEFLSIEAPLTVCQSAGGFYIGAVASEEIYDLGEDGLLAGAPLARDSAEYYPTREAAEAALKSGSWTQRQHP